MQYGNYGMVGPSNFLERGLAQGKNRGGPVKSFIQKAIKSYIGGMAGDAAVSSLGGQAGGVMDSVMSGKQGLQQMVTDQTGLPIGPEAIVGRMGEAGGFDPTDIKRVQGMMARRDPRRKYGDPTAGIGEIDPNLQPEPTTSTASNQINRQGVVRDLVAQRFGEGSPITQYIGAYDHGTPPGGVVVPGNPAAGPDSQRIILDATPNERIHVEPAPKVYPDYPGPHFPTPGVSEGFTAYPPTAGRFQGDVLVPADRPETGLQKGLSWLSFIAGKFQGDNPWEDSAARQKWNYGQDASRSIRNAKLQRAAEGKAGRTDYEGYAAEQLALNAMQAEIGVKETGVLGQIGQERNRVVGMMADGTGRTKSVQERFMVGPEGGVEWMPTPDGYAGPTAGVPAGSDRKIFYDSAGNETEGATAQKYRVSHYNRGTGTWDKPTGPMIRIEAGLGAAGLLRVNADDEQKYSEAKALEAALSKAPGWKTEGGAQRLDADTRAFWMPFVKRIASNRPTDMLDPAKLAEYIAIQKVLTDMFGDFLGRSITAGEAADDPEAGGLVK